MKGTIGIFIVVALIGYGVVTAIDREPITAGLCVVAAFLVFAFWPVDRSAEK